MAEVAGAQNSGTVQLLQPDGAWLAAASLAQRSPMAGALPTTEHSGLHSPSEKPVSAMFGDVLESISITWKLPVTEF